MNQTATALFSSVIVAPLPSPTSDIEGRKGHVERRKAAISRRNARIAPPARTTRTAGATAPARTAGATASAAGHRRTTLRRNDVVAAERGTQIEAARFLHSA